MGGFFSRQPISSSAPSARKDETYEISTKTDRKDGQPAIPSETGLKDKFSAAYQLIDDVVLKKYVTRLSAFPVRPLESAMAADSIRKMRLFRITEMVYQQNETATYKFSSVFNAVAATKSAIVTVIDSDGEKTEFYLGIRSLSEDNSTQMAYSTLINAMRGQFPGTRLENLKNDEIARLMNAVEADSLSAVSCVANTKSGNLIDNDNYLQGLEKLALAMQGNRYTAVIIANSTPQEQVDFIRQTYENIYTQLSPMANAVVSYGTNRAETGSDTETHGSNRSTAHSSNSSTTETQTQTTNTGTIRTTSEKTPRAKVGSGIGAALAGVGAVLGGILGGPAGAKLGVAGGAFLGGQIGSSIGGAVSAATDASVSETSGGGSVSHATAKTSGTSDTETNGSSYSLARTLGFSTGETQSLQRTVQNKPISDMLARLDQQLKRLDEFESVGMWECAAYFLSGDSSTSEVAASTYKALVSGEGSGLEVSAINNWSRPLTALPDAAVEIDRISEYVRSFMHPVFSYRVSGKEIPVTPANLVSGNELAVHMGLPRHSVRGFPVIEHADFEQEVVRYGKAAGNASLKLGRVFNMGRPLENSQVRLDLESLAMHTLITGSTGSGKSNAIYHLLQELTSARRDTFSFLVIEPAKGEYKRVLGHKKGVRVFGTNPAYTELLRINPFRFPLHIHVLEHIDRLIEIFNVCWPMYAAMPAVLKEAVIQSYEFCGWDTAASRNLISETLFPTFRDLQEQLVRVIDASGYSEEVKSNYKGSLLTRVNSLTNGLNALIFSADEIESSVLFDSNVIVDLSRVGAPETKALFMGILVMRLSEYRMTPHTAANLPLRHITVLEEAHHILPAAVGQTTEDGGTIAGKSVEMISNAIAEMRTFGEGFLIADQSPGALDVSAIRNTNTKMIFRLPEEVDRRVAGKAAALKDAQLDEIAKLPGGVAAVYQNDWIAPVLCQVEKYEGVEKEYERSAKGVGQEYSKASLSLLLSFVLRSRLDVQPELRPEELEKAVETCACSGRMKARLYALLREYRRTHSLTLWADSAFPEQSNLVRDLLQMEHTVATAHRTFSDPVDLRLHLNTLLGQELGAVSEDLLLQTCHALVKSYSLTGLEGEKVYAEWYHSMPNLHQP